MPLSDQCPMKKWPRVATMPQPHLPYFSDLKIQVKQTRTAGTRHTEAWFSTARAGPSSVASISSQKGVPLQAPQRSPPLKFRPYLVLAFPTEAGKTTGPIQLSGWIMCRTDTDNGLAASQSVPTTILPRMHLGTPGTASKQEWEMGHVGAWGAIRNLILVWLGEGWVQRSLRTL